jgi:hypothetical protein
MRVQSRHARSLDASVEEVGRLVAALGGERDVLWPNEQWPGTQLRFDRPLAVGARGGHGVIRYSVEEYEPGRCVRFRFEPGQGLDGFHRFDIVPLPDGRTRLAHTLDARLEGATRLARPLLLPMHDTLIRQLLDNARRATGGRVAKPTPMAWWMRALNAIEARATARADRRGAAVSGARA